MRTSKLAWGKRHRTHRLTYAVKPWWPMPKPNHRARSKDNTRPAPPRHTTIWTIRRYSHAKWWCYMICEWLIQCSCGYMFTIIIFLPFSSVIIQKRWESLERPCLSRAQSLRMHGSNCGEEGLKRVCSAPQLGDQYKGSLLKRKLSVSDTEPCVVYSGSSKHKKQGQWLIPPLLFSFVLPHVLLYLNYQNKDVLLMFIYQ